MAEGRKRPRRGGGHAARLLRVLLIDDEALTLLPVLAQGLQSQGFEVICEAEPNRALEAITNNKPDVILLDLNFPGDSIPTTGARLLVAIRKQFASLAVVVFTTRLDDVSIPVETFDQKPHGYIAKPKFGTNRNWPRTLSQVLRDAIDAARYADEVSSNELGFFVGQTKQMRDAAGQIRIAARNSIPVLIFGESGTGKRTAAEAIHRLSQRSGRFEALRCSAMDAETLDRTLFGEVGERRKGSTPGLFTMAHKGTLFLDGIHKLPLGVQHKLVAAIEGGADAPASTTEHASSDVRLIAATNHDLADLVADGALAEELAYRLQGTVIALSPIRTRKADLPSFFDLFVTKSNKVTKRHVLLTLRPETLAKLDDHSWPGNIRELEAVILQAVAHTNANVLLPDDITIVNLRRPTAAPSPDGPPSAASEPAAHDSVTSLTNQLEALALNERYAFLKDLGETLRKPVAEEFIYRLAKRIGRRVTHKDIAAALAPATSKNLDTIRQFIISSCKVRLTQLECNQ